MQSGRFSRYLDEFVDVASTQDQLAVLLDLFPPAEKRSRPVLIPTSDADVQVVIDNASELARRYSFQDSYKDGTAAKILAKNSFYELCERHSVRFPRIWNVPKEQMRSLLPELSFPCIIKPARIHDIKRWMRGRKVWIVRDPEDYEQTVESFPDDAGIMLVQEIVPGPESEITLCCFHRDRLGHERQAFMARKLRQFPPGFGSASLVESRAEPETERISKEFLANLDYHGIAALEFKRHAENGELYIIEVNVRPSLWFALSSAAGRDTVLAAYAELSGMEEPLAEFPQRQSCRWRYNPKDMASAIFYRLRPGFVLPPPEVHLPQAPSCKVWAVFADDDPRPVIGELANWAVKLQGRFAEALLGGRR
jgi:predicted ATP-grasp superfamily ATP-dependent carboligase